MEALRRKRWARVGAERNGYGAERDAEMEATAGVAGGVLWGFGSGRAGDGARGGDVVPGADEGGVESAGLGVWAGLDAALWVDGGGGVAGLGIAGWGEAAAGDFVVLRAAGGEFDVELCVFWRGDAGAGGGGHCADVGADCGDDGVFLPVEKGGGVAAGSLFGVGDVCGVFELGGLGAESGIWEVGDLVASRWGCGGRGRRCW